MSEEVTNNAPELANDVNNNINALTSSTSTELTKSFARHRNRNRNNTTSTTADDGYNNNNYFNPSEIQDSRFRCCSLSCKNACLISCGDPRDTSTRAYTIFYDLYKSSQLCDAVIHTLDGSQFQVHRFIMIGNSDFFRAAFITTINHGHKQVLEITEVSAELIKIIIEFLYCRTIKLTPETVCKILEAADYLGIVHLKNVCSDFIQEQIDFYNCFGIRNFARNFFCEDLYKAATNFILLRFVEISTRSTEFLDLPLEEILSIYREDNLNVKTEEPVWEAALRWIKHRPSTRKEYVVDFISQIRTGLMETQYFMEHVKEHEYVIGNAGCRPIVIETLRFLYDLEVITEKDGELPTPGIARPRIPHEILFAIGGWSGGSPTNFMETYDTRADRWIRIEEVDPSGPRAYHGTIAIKYDIFIIGGFDGQEYFNSCRRFDAVTKIWHEIAPMNAKRCYVSVAQLEDKYIYAMGGYDGHLRQNTAEKYDPDINQWSMIATMNAQRSDACAASISGKIYIVGGFNGHECLNSAEIYTPEVNQWTIIPSMRNRRSGVSCVAFHNQLFVIGGFNGVSRMCSGEKFNPETLVWSGVPDMYNPRSNFAIEVIDDLIFCIGGFNGVTTIYHVECYDEKNTEWYEATDMNIYRSALSACVIQGLPNVNDYIHQHRERLMEEKRQRLLVLQQN